MKTLINDLKNKTSYSVSFLLSNEVKDTLSSKGVLLRKFLPMYSPALRKIFKSKSNYELIMDYKAKLTLKERINGKIFLHNHRQADDIVLGVNASKASGYVLFGNATLLQETDNGIGLFLYGVIPVSRDNKASRTASTEKKDYVIKRKGNNHVWGEGYWNLDDDGLGDEKHAPDDRNSESWLMQDINIGTIKDAQKSGRPIIPVVLHYDEIGKKKCYARRLEPFYVKPADDIWQKKEELIEIMQTNIYELMEKYSSYDREGVELFGMLQSAQKKGEPITIYTWYFDAEHIKQEVPLETIYINPEDDILHKAIELTKIVKKCSSYTNLAIKATAKTLKEQWQELKSELVASCAIPRIGYELDLDNERLIGKAKVIEKYNPFLEGEVYEHITPNEFAFEHLKQIDYNKINAFLLSKKLKGIRK